MKSEYVRIYSEKELRRKVQQTSAMLKDMKQKIAADPSFRDIDALTKMWLQYEFTRFVVSESLYSEDDEYAYEPCLFVEREVENNYSDDLTDPNTVFAQVLDAFYGGKRDFLTLRMLNLNNIQ